jgi:hypothetical protein
LRCFVPHLHTITSCVRSGLCIHNTASFRYTPQATFHCIPAILCLQPSVFSAVAPSLSHRAWLRLPHLRYLRSIHFQLSIIHYQLSVGSVALPYIKVHRQKGGCLLFFTRRFTLIAATFRFVPPLNSRVYGGCSIAATPPRRSSSAKKSSLP